MKEKLNTLIDEVMAANKRGAKVDMSYSIHEDNTHYIHVWENKDDVRDYVGDPCYYRDGQWFDYSYDIDKLINDVKSL